jgi:hypothetical protein
VGKLLCPKRADGVDYQKPSALPSPATVSKYLEPRQLFEKPSSQAKEYPACYITMQVAPTEDELRNIIQGPGDVEWR